MAQRKLSERNVRKLTRTGSGKSFSLTIPLELIQKLGWRRKQKVVVTREGRGLKIKDWKK